MNITILLMMASVALVVLCVCVIRMKVRNRVDNLDAVVFTLAFGFEIFAIVVSVLFTVFSRPVAVETNDYKLESFQEFDNGYGYSYYDEADKLMGGFVKKDTVRLDFYDEGPFVSMDANKTRRQFWIFYFDQDVDETNYVFHVARRDGTVTS